MYQPVEFTDDDAHRARSHIERYPFGVLVLAGRHGLGAAHLPFLTADPPDAARARTGPGYTLEGHGAVRNPLLAEVEDGSEVLVIFPGPHAYVSPVHYRAETDVPTWNYTAVHVNGRIRIADAVRTRGILERTVRTAERSPNGHGWSLAHIPPTMLASLARGVVGFTVDIDRVEGGYKLSQDKLEPDVRSVERALGESGGTAADVAGEMRRAAIPGRTGAPSTDPEVWLGPMNDS
jgi:transcriptional regulator